MKKVFQLAALALVVAGCGCGMSPQDRLTVNDKKINEASDDIRQTIETEI